MRSGGGHRLESLRTTYAQALTRDQEMSSTLDTLRSARYGDFLRFGRLPRSSDGLAQHYASGRVIQDGNIESPEVIIFFSYRWINRSPGALTPDDAENTQYKRMIAAAEHYLQLHPGVNRETFSVWVVSQNPSFILLSICWIGPILHGFLPHLASNTGQPV